MKERLILDLDNFFNSNVGANGLNDSDIDAQEARRAFDAFTVRREKGETGFADLGSRQDLAESCLEVAADIRSDASDFLHLGIGGSALGPRALVRALTHPMRNFLDDSSRGGPRIFFVENVDPESLNALGEVINPSRTWVNVVSKSGGTLETLSQWLVIREWLVSELGEKEARRRTVFTTDPERGFLRKVAREAGVRTLEIPQNVGGRFSALSPVGLLPLAVAGVDPASLLEGARGMTEHCSEGELENNPALRLAAALHALDTRKAKVMHVLMVYADALADTAEWYQQLWAESLGKRLSIEGHKRFAGPTPLKAVGAVDQHSQLQLFLEGPEDKAVMFLGARELRAKVDIPEGSAAREEIAYLGGHEIGEILNVERRATTEALTRHGRPNATILLDRIDPATMGALYQLFFHATAYAGELYGLNAYDQPAVELGKRIAQRLLGRTSRSPEGHASTARTRPPGKPR